MLEKKQVSLTKINYSTVMKPGKVGRISYIMPSLFTTTPVVSSCSTSIASIAYTSHIFFFPMATPAFFLAAWRPKVCAAARIAGHFMTATQRSIIGSAASVRLKGCIILPDGSICPKSPISHKYSQSFASCRGSNERFNKVE